MREIRTLRATWRGLETWPKAEHFRLAGAPVLDPTCERLGVRLPGPTRQLVGDFRNGGQEWHPQGKPEEVRVHDFLIKDLGRAVPYGIYDLAANAGWVSVGMDHDTAAFAVQTIRLLMLTGRSKRNAAHVGAAEPVSMSWEVWCT